MGGMANEQDRSASAGNRSKDTARYANYFKVRMNPFELMMEFGQFHTEDTEPEIHTRVVTTPPFGKEFLNLLAESIHECEAASGPIPSPSGLRSPREKSPTPFHTNDETEN
jgi:hypothetical protein